MKTLVKILLVSALGMVGLHALSITTPYQYSSLLMLPDDPELSGLAKMSCKGGMLGQKNLYKSYTKFVNQLTSDKDHVLEWNNMAKKTGTSSQLTTKTIDALIAKVTRYRDYLGVKSKECAAKGN